MKEISLTEKEIEVLKSCIFMAFREGLYDFCHLRVKGELIDVGEEDIEIILQKFGMSKEDAEKFIKDCI